MIESKLDLLRRRRFALEDRYKAVHDLLTSIKKEADVVVQRQMWDACKHPYVRGLHGGIIPRFPKRVAEKKANDLRAKISSIYRQIAEEVNS